MWWIASALWAQDTRDFSQVLNADFQREFVGIVQIRQNNTLIYQYAKGNTIADTAIDATSLLPVSSLISHTVSLMILNDLKSVKGSKEDRLQQYLPRLNKDALGKDGVFCSVAHLLSHRCGLPTFVPGQQADIGTFFSALNRIRLKDKPGQNHRFSYAGDALAFELLKSFHVEDPYQVLQRELYQGCDIWGEIPPNRSNQQMESVFYSLGMYGSVEDWFHVPHTGYKELANHSVASADGLSCWFNTLLQQDRWKELLQSSEEHYGLGVAFEKKVYGDVIWHSSKVPLQSSGYWGLVPKTGYSVVVLSPQSNAPYSPTRIGRALLDTVHGLESRTAIGDFRFGGKLQASLPVIVPLLTVLIPLIIAVFLVMRPPIPRLVFAMRLQSCFFAAIFVRLSTPFATIPMYEWGGMLLLFAIMLFRGLRKRIQAPLYPAWNLGLIAEFGIYSLLMMTWIRRVPNPTPLFCSVGIMAILVSSIHTKKTD